MLCPWKRYLTIETHTSCAVERLRAAVNQKKFKNEPTAVVGRTVGDKAN